MPRAAIQMLRRAVAMAPEDPIPASGSGVTAWLLLAGLSVFGLWLAGDLLRLPYVSDDLTLLMEAANLRSGSITWWQYLARGHNEHRVPVLRLLYWAAAFGGNLDAYWLRVAVLSVHVVCAWLVSLLMLRLWGLWQTAAVALVMAGSVGFSSMPIWAPSTAVFSLSLAFLLLASHQLLAGRRAVATVALVLAALSLNASVLAFPLLVAAFWLRLGPGTRERALWAALWLGIGGVILYWTSGVGATAAAPDAARLEASVRNAVFVVLSAPYRWIVACTTGSVGATPGWPVIAMVFTGWGLAHWAVPHPVRPLAVMLSLGASLLAAAVGYGRWDFTPETLYNVDRYYYWYAASFAVVAVALFARAIQADKQHWRFGLIAAAACVSAGVQAAGTLEPIKHVRWIQLSAAGADSARKLGDLLGESAAAAPLLVADGFVPVPGLHLDGLTLMTLSYSMSWRGIAQLGFVRSPGPEAERRLNAVLTEWARQEGWPGPPVFAENGRFKPSIGGRINFELGAFKPQIVSGFHEWDGHARWMSRRGAVDLDRKGESRLHIKAAAPIQALRQVMDLGTKFEVAVVVDGIPLGTLNFDKGDRADVVFSLPLKPDSVVRVTLESRFTWYGRQISKANEDPRELSISAEVIELLP